MKTYLLILLTLCSGSALANCYELKSKLLDLDNKMNDFEAAVEEKISTQKSNLLNSIGMDTAKNNFESFVDPSIREELFMKTDSRNGFAQFKLNAASEINLIKDFSLVESNKLLLERTLLKIQSAECTLEVSELVTNMIHSKLLLLDNRNVAIKKKVTLFINLIYDVEVELLLTQNLTQISESGVL